MENMFFLCNRTCINRVEKSIKKVKKMLAAKKFLATSPSRGTKRGAPMLAFVREDYYRIPNVYFFKEKRQFAYKLQRSKLWKKKFCV